MNITNAIREVARARPGSVAIIGANDTAMSYRTLDRLIDRIARRVLVLGFRPGETVCLAIVGQNEALALILALALARIGVASADLELPARHLSAAFVQPGAKQLPDA